MKSVYIYRDKYFQFTQMETVGILVIPNDEHMKAYRTLELPYKNNLPEISCIPDGVYACQWTRSNRLSKIKGIDIYTYEVLNVPNRSGIRIHSVNYVADLKGCIALGMSLADINKDGIVDLAESKKALEDFNNYFQKEPFSLTIKWI